MKFIYCVLSVLAVAYANPIFLQTSGSGRIVGGENVSITDIPYQVSVRSSGSHICGGSILSEKVVLTAGHCISSNVEANTYSIQYGISKIGGNENVISADRVLRHELYDSSTIDYDIGLIYLNENIILGALARVVSLPNTSAMTGVECVASGWGTTAEGSGLLASILQKVTLNIIDRDICADRYKPYSITDQMLCAGGTNGGRDSCQGDSGGPLVTDAINVIGIVSWGIGCARPTYPGVYTNVFALNNWIKSNLKT